MKNLLFFLILLSPIGSAAQTDCEFTQTMCQAQIRHEQSDADLNEIYQTILETIKSNGFEGYLVPQKPIYKSLQKSQRAWLKYRDANCEATYTLLSGGTSKNIDRLECLTKMTKQRSEHLSELYL